MKSLEQPKIKEEIRRRLLSVSADSQRRWGKMTANQMICHLTDAFRGVTGEISAAPTGNLFHRTIFKWLFFCLPWIPVKNYPTSPEIDQKIGGTRPVDFDRDKKELIKRFEHFTSGDWDAEALTHPTMGKLSKHQWYRWAYLHIDHHLRQFGAF